MSVLPGPVSTTSHYPRRQEQSGRVTDDGILFMSQEGPEQKEWELKCCPNLTFFLPYLGFLRSKQDSLYMSLQPVGGGGGLCLVTPSPCRQS